MSRPAGRLLRALATGLALWPAAAGAADAPGAHDPAPSAVTVQQWWMPRSAAAIRAPDGGFAWRGGPGYALDRDGLPTLPGDAGGSAAARHVLLIDAGEGFDPEREAYGDALPALLQRRLNAAPGGRPVRVHYGGFPELDSLRLRRRLQRLLRRIRPDAVVILGAGYDRYVVDPRKPPRPVADGGLAQALAAPGLPVLPWKSVDGFLALRVVPEIFRLRLAAGDADWEAGTRDTRIERRGDALAIVSDRSRYHYQLLTRPVAVDPGRAYVVTYGIHVMAGAMSIGALDVVANRWIVNTMMPAGVRLTRTFRFTAPSGRVRIVVSNNNETPAISRAALGAIALSRTALDPVGARGAPEAKSAGAAGRFTLETGAPSVTWTAATPSTRITAADGALLVVSDDSAFHYQLVSATIAVTPGAAYAVDYAVEVTDGVMALGVLDAMADRWIVQQAVAGGKPATLRFTAAGPQVRIILANDNAKPAVSRAIVRRLRMAPVGGEAAPAHNAESSPPDDVEAPRLAAFFGDAAVLAFSRANLRGMIADSRAAGAAVVLASAWARDIAADASWRRRRHQAYRWPAIFSLEQERLHFIAWNEAVRAAGRDAGVPVLAAPAVEVTPAGLARALASDLERLGVPGR